MSSPPQSSSKPKHQPQSHLLSIAAEVRLTIWKLSTPSDERVVLDAWNLTQRHPFGRGEYGSASSLLHVCKQAHAEVFPLLYSRNSITIVNPDLEFDILESISKAALQCITTVEICLKRRLREACDIWADLKFDLPSLKHLKLNFYRSKNWLRDLARIAIYCEGAQNVLLRLQLFKSSWATRSKFTTDSNTIDNNLTDAKNHGHLYPIALPDGVKRMTVAVSAGAEAADAFENFGDKYSGWLFLKDMSKDTSSCKNFVWYGDTFETKVEWLEKELEIAHRQREYSNFTNQVE